MTLFKFKLYITNKSPKSLQAITEVKDLLKNISMNNKIKTELKIVDILKEEELNENWLVVTPMLIKTFPPPEKRVFGDFSNFEQTLILLGLGDLKLGE